MSPRSANGMVNGKASPRGNVTPSGRRTRSALGAEVDAEVLSLEMQKGKVEVEDEAQDMIEAEEEDAAGDVVDVDGDGATGVDAIAGDEEEDAVDVAMNGA